VKCCIATTEQNLLLLSPQAAVGWQFFSKFRNGRWSEKGWETLIYVNNHRKLKLNLKYLVSGRISGFQFLPDIRRICYPTHLY